MDYISQANVGGTAYGLGLPNIYINNKGNFNIETSTDLGNTSKGKINIEAMDDIQLKPGDDIVLYSHHRAEDKQDEVAVKVTDGDDLPVKLQLNAAEVVLTTKDKTGNNADVMDITVNSAQNTRGYLKLRAQAIDLRSETHGGIALQPKGFDSDSNMNKIKFEHGGGDGLEFGTFNTEKTSIFTDEYRFNKDGVWKMATRVTEVSDKADANDDTTALKYVKQADDFYDVISQDDVTATTEDIIKTANAFNYGKNRHAKITNSGNLEIATVDTFLVTPIEDNEALTDMPYVSADYNNSAELLYTPGQDGEQKILNVSDVFDILGYTTSEEEAFITDLGESIHTIEEFYIQVNDPTPSHNSMGCWQFTKISDTPKIKIESDSGIDIKTLGKLGLKGELDFGSNFNFGETDKGISTIVKRTKKNATKDCGVLQVVAVNNSSSAYSFNTIWDPTANDNAGANQSETTVSVPAGSSQVIAQCSLYDVIKLVNYMKDNTSGPWAAQQ